MYQFLDILQGADNDAWALLVHCACRFDGAHRVTGIVHRFTLKNGDVNTATSEWGFLRQIIEQGQLIESSVETLSFEECIARFMQEAWLFTEQQEAQTANAPALLKTLVLKEPS